MLLCLFIAALWSPAGTGLTCWLLLVMFFVFLLLSCGILGHVWYLIVLFPDLCLLSYFEENVLNMKHVQNYIWFIFSTFHTVYNFKARILY